MWIRFLGTSATIPTDRRSLPSIAVQIGGEVILMDVGEGAQVRMMRAGISPVKVSRILITHLHGDHVLGLPGLLQSMALMGRESTLEIYGPPGVAELVSIYERTSPYRRGYPILVKEILKSGTIYRGEKYRITAAPNRHVFPGYAYVIETPEKPGRINVEKAVSLGLKPGPEYRLLKMGIPVKVGGRTIRPEDVVGPPRKGIKIVYTGDTAPSDDIVEAAKGADVLIHDATFASTHVDVAREAMHSTALQAAEVALRAGVKLLVLFHLSARYRDPGILAREASRLFPFVLVAEDMTVLRLGS